MGSIFGNGNVIKNQNKKTSAESNSRWKIGMRPPHRVAWLRDTPFFVAWNRENPFLLREFVKWHPCVMRERQRFHAWIRENVFFLRECVKRPACVMHESPKVSTLKSHNAGLLNTEVIYLKKQPLLDSVTLVWRSLVTTLYELSTNAHIYIFLERTWYYFWMILPHVVSVFRLLIPSPKHVGSTFSYKWKS